MTARFAVLALAFALAIAAPAPAQVFWTMSGSAGDEVQRANADGTGYVSLVNPTPGTSPWAVAAAPAQNRLYWSDIISPNFSVYRAAADGSGATPIYNSTASAMSLAYDPAGDRLFVGTGTTIVRVGGDGSNPTPLLTGLATVNGIALDLAAGKVYWTEQAANRIARANLDGTNVETVVNTTYAATTTERGLTLDGLGNVYWTDSATDGVYTANVAAFAGTPVPATQIVNLATLLGTGASPNGIASDGTSLFWTEAASGALRGVYRSALDGSGAAQLVPTAPSAFAPIGIAAVAAVPEPSALALAGLAAAGWALRRRRAAKR